MSNFVQCPQCGFQEFDEHAGCAVCGFQSQAALRTGDAALKSSDGNLIEFPRKKTEPEKPAASISSAVPNHHVDLPLFTGVSAASSSTGAPSPTVWREELQEKLRQYRARREEQKKAALTEEDISELTERFPLGKEKPGALEAESVSALDEAFKMHPSARTAEASLDLPVRPTAAMEPDHLEGDRSDLHSRFPRVEKPVASEVNLLPDFQKVPPPSPAPLMEEDFQIPSRQDVPREAKVSAAPPANKSFELPESVQRIKQQRQSPHRSELFQQSLIFEASRPPQEASRDGDHIILPIPAASSSDRFRAGVFDLFIILLVEGLCLLPAFAVARIMHWTLRPAPRSLIILSAVAVALALAYLLFFTALMRKTLGMKRRELVLINFAGQFPTLGETILRTLGYLVSAGSLLLGFLWVLFDVEALAWHDRISRTYPVHLRDLKPDS